MTTPELKEKSKLSLIKRESEWRSVQHNMVLMDQFYDAKFCNWVRDERNAISVGINLRRIVNDYSIEKIVNGLRWLFVGWKMISIVSTIKQFQLPTEKEIDLIDGLVIDWSNTHIAEFLTLLYSDSDDKEQSQIVKGIFIKLEQKKKIDSIVKSLESLHFKYDLSSIIYSQ